MKDIITYCADTNKLVVELQAKYPEFLNIQDKTNPRFTIRNKASYGIRNGKETLKLIRASREDLSLLNDLENLEILGTYDEVFNDPEKEEIYNRVYDQTPIEIEIKDDDGKVIDTHTHTPPRKFVVFA